eukprot:GHVN01097814.1.p2 GENE.GHVN01097814.1~~GHVN01097814.1.p2  ORF type:complete len:101 (+),score=0.25 GHVN01097814.1:1572-1874(+)
MYSIGGYEIQTTGYQIQGHLHNAVIGLEQLQNLGAVIYVSVKFSKPKTRGLERSTFLIVHLCIFQMIHSKSTCRRQAIYNLLLLKQLMISILPGIEAVGL